MVASCKLCQISRSMLAGQLLIENRGLHLVISRSSNCTIWSTLECSSSRGRCSHLQHIGRCLQCTGIWGGRQIMQLHSPQMHPSHRLG